jgi:hypothetical protein
VISAPEATGVAPLDAARKASPETFASSPAAFFFNVAARSSLMLSSRFAFLESVEDAATCTSSCEPIDMNADPGLADGAPYETGAGVVFGA